MGSRACGPDDRSLPSLPMASVLRFVRHRHADQAVGSDDQRDQELHTRERLYGPRPATERTVEVIAKNRVDPGHAPLER